MTERPILFSAPMVRAILSGAKTQTRRVVKPQPTQERDLLWWWFGGRGQERRSSTLHDTPDGLLERCPYGAPGDRLWVRETWYCDNYTERDFDAARVGHVTPRADAEIIAEWRESLYYRADTASGRGSCCELIPECMCAEYKTSSGRRRSPWKPGIHMPRWASRITLEVTSVRVERLQAITEEDARAEGIEPLWRTRKIYPSKYAADVSTQSFRDGFYTLWCEINGDDSWSANPFVWVVQFKRLEQS